MSTASIFILNFLHKLRFYITLLAQTKFKFRETITITVTRRVLVLLMRSGELISKFIHAINIVSKSSASFSFSYSNYKYVYCYRRSNYNSYESCGMIRKEHSLYHYYAICQTRHFLIL